MEFLSAIEYAELRGCSRPYITKLINSGKLPVEEISGLIGGSSGIQYRIPLASIEPKLIKKWQRLHKKEIQMNEDVPQAMSIVPVKANLERLSADERKEIADWNGILAEWQQYRNRATSKEQADNEYVNYLRTTYPGIRISRRTLLKKWKDLKEKGDKTLMDMRGKHKNHKKALPNEVYDIFEYFYLDQSKKSITKCIELTELQLKAHNPELLPLPSYNTIVRAITDRTPAPVLKYFREGEKAFRDKCAPYIQRMYDDLASNDIWVCDNHTYDVFVNDGECEKPIRVYITGFLDVRSRKMVGWYVTDAPRSDATLYALRRGIDAYGIPKVILSDNGREFLTHDIGGRGFRKTVKTEDHEPPTILQLLGIEFKTAMVRNAKAKIIERAFLDVKEGFSKLFGGYTGGTIAERPERLKKTGKLATNFTLLEEFVGYVDTWIKGNFNKEKHRGAGMNGRTRDQVFAECLYEQRVATPDELNLMMLRNSRMMKVQRSGVSIKFYEKELFYNDDELLLNHIGEKVYVRFNPDDLNQVRVYDEEDRFLLSAGLKTKLSYFASKEEIQKAMKENRTLEKAVKAYKKQKDIQADNELDLIINEAAERMKEEEYLDPKIIIPIRRFDEVGEVRAVVGDDMTIDWGIAVERLRAAKEE